MKKELICALSAALLLVSLTACGDSQADQPSEPDPTPTAVQTEALPIKQSEAISPPIEANAPAESDIPVSEEPTTPVMEESTEPSEVIPATEPPAQATVSPASITPAATEPPASVESLSNAPANNGETVNSPKDDIERYPADPSISIPPGTRFWDSEYVGEIEGYVYHFGLGYAPEGGNLTIIHECTLPDFYEIVGH